MFQLSNNLIRVKTLAVEWAKDRQKANQKDLEDVEVSLETLLDQNSSSVFSEEKFKQLKDLEYKKTVLLKLEETKWRLENQAIWTSKGDNNTKSFHKYATFWKTFNTIWE
jgi:hypothetical protein